MAAPGDIGAYGYGIAAGVGANREDLLDLISNISPYDGELSPSRVIC